jgi:hypothetical protein
MSGIFGRLGFSDDARLEEGTPDEVARKRAARARATNVEAARRNTHWTEIVDDLVQRPFGYLVSAATDKVYLRHRGSVFGPGGGIAFDEMRPLVFVVRGDNFVVVLEEQPESWTELYERRERRRLGVVA